MAGHRRRVQETTRQLTSAARFPHDGFCGCISSIGQSKVGISWTERLLSPPPPLFCQGSDWISGVTHCRLSASAGPHSTWESIILAYFLQVHKSAAGVHFIDYMCSSKLYTLVRFMASERRQSSELFRGTYSGDVGHLTPVPAV